jgi:hypothetical protein
VGAGYLYSLWRKCKRSITAKGDASKLTRQTDGTGEGSEKTIVRAYRVVQEDGEQKQSTANARLLEA